ncbi:MAG: phthalate 4,5-dioxygenase [Chloroflexi bacterium]|nr:phthalate 4,5-dioxygenase [Chloroflexota bacterium]
MPSAEENDLLTRTGPGTPMGDLIRRYWQPAALSREIPLGGAPVPLKLLGEELVLFRDEAGRPGLIGLHCAHRGADLSYGRLEDGGLRCIYHGWVYDVNGRCLEQPGEPAGSTFHERIRHRAYPCREAGGIVYTYMGPDQPPLLPPYEFVGIPETNRNNYKVFQDCNFLQSNEGNLDPTHLSFLHLMADDDPEAAQTLCKEDRHPTIETEDTDFGVRIYCIRRVHGDRNYVRVTNFVLPNFAAVSGTPGGYAVNWHVPIDDEHHWRFGIRFNRARPMPPGTIQSDRDGGVGADHRLGRSRANRYLQDRETMQTWSFTGLGRNFVTHDAWATEGAGPIQDRTQEHLGSADRGIVAGRSQLLQALKDVREGRDPKGVWRDRSAPSPQMVVRSDTLLPASVDWRNYWEDDSIKPELTTTIGAGIPIRA